MLWLDEVVRAGCLGGEAPVPADGVSPRDPDEQSLPVDLRTRAGANATGLNLRLVGQAGRAVPRGWTAGSP